MNGFDKDTTITAEATMVAVGERSGKVVLTFSKPIQWLPLDPENARQIAEQMAKSAYTARYGREPTGEPRSMITEKLRKHMRSRATIIIRTLMEENRGPGYIANHVVDAILRELA